MKIPSCFMSKNGLVDEEAFEKLISKSPDPQHEQRNSFRRWLWPILFHAAVVFLYTVIAVTVVNSNLPSRLEPSGLIFCEVSLSESSR